MVGFCCPRKIQWSTERVARMRLLRACGSGQFPCGFRHPQGQDPFIIRARRKSGSARRLGDRQPLLADRGSDGVAPSPASELRQTFLQKRRDPFAEIHRRAACPLQLRLKVKLCLQGLLEGPPQRLFQRPVSPGRP